MTTLKEFKQDFEKTLHEVGKVLVLLSCAKGEFPSYSKQKMYKDAIAEIKLYISGAY